LFGLGFNAQSSSIQLSHPVSLVFVFLLSLVFQDLVVDVFHFHFRHFLLFPSFSSETKKCAVQDLKVRGQVFHFCLGVMHFRKRPFFILTRLAFGSIGFARLRCDYLFTLCISDSNWPGQPSFTSKCLVVDSSLTLTVDCGFSENSCPRFSATTFSKTQHF
jgi:hypothetical protein